VPVIQASADLDDQLNSIIEVSWGIEWTLDNIRELLEKLDGNNQGQEIEEEIAELKLNLA